MSKKFNPFYLRVKVLLSIRLSILLLLLNAGISFFASNSYGQIAPLPAGRSFTLSPTNFMIDGFLEKQGTVGDWLPDLFNNAGTSVNPLAFHYIDAINATDKIFDGSNTASQNPNGGVWKWKVGTAINKANINHALLFLAKDNIGDSWGMFSGDRLSPSGTTGIDFEFLQKTLVLTTDPTDPNKGGFQSDGLDGGRSIGDILVSVQFQSTAPKVIFYRWSLSNGNYFYQVFTPSSNEGFTAVNNIVINVPYNAFGSATYAENSFIEGAVNLTKLIQTSSNNPCSGANFKTLFIKTKSTDAINGNMDDFLDPVQINLSIGSTSISYNNNNPVCNNVVNSLAVTFGTNPVTTTGTFSAINGGAGYDNPSGLSINPTTGAINVTASTPGKYKVQFAYSVGNCPKTTTVDVTIVVCCEFTATCPATSDLGTFDCKTLGNIPAHPGSESAAEAAPYNMVIGNNPCGIIRVSSTDNAIPNKCSTSDQTITRTLVVYDDLNKDNIKDANEPSKTCTYIYVIKADVTAPVLPTAPLAASYQCAKDVPAAQTLTAQDNCSGTVTGVPSDGAPTSDPCNYSFVRTWTFTDACGNPSSVKQTITVKDDTAPGLTGTLPTGATNQNLCYNAIPAGPTSAAIAALYTEKCSKVTVTKTGAPTGDNCNWTVTYHYVIKDDCGNQAAPVDIIYGGGDKTPPKITCPADKTITCGSSTAGTTLGTGIATATDNCGGTVKITYTDITSSCGNDSYVITRTWKATDPCQNSSECVQKITVNTKLIAGCFTAQLTKRVFDGKNTTFTFNACANGCLTALSNIAFVIANGIKVVSPLNGSNYQGNFSQYKVSVPVSKTVNGIKYEVIGEGIKNAACDVFTFSLAGDQTSLPITVEFKAGTKTTSVIIKPEVCLCQQTQSIVSKLVPAIAIHDNLTVAAYPNPFMDEVTFTINSPKSGKGILELHDVVGRKLGVVYNGYLFEGKSQVIIYNVPPTFKGALIYTLRVGKEQVNGKLIRMK